MATHLIPRAMREKFEAADARYEAVARAAKAFGAAAPQSERTRTALWLARWRMHIDACKWEARECWFAGGFRAEAVLRAFDDALTTDAPACVPASGS